MLKKLEKQLKQPCHLTEIDGFRRKTDGFWRILTDSDGFWRILTESDENAQKTRKSMKIDEIRHGNRRILTDLDGFRRIPTDSDGFWRILTDLDGFQQISLYLLSFYVVDSQCGSKSHNECDWYCINLLLDVSGFAISWESVPYQMMQVNRVHTRPQGYDFHLLDWSPHGFHSKVMGLACSSKSNASACWLRLKKEGVYRFALRIRITRIIVVWMLLSEEWNPTRWFAACSMRGYTLKGFFCSVQLLLLLWCLPAQENNIVVNSICKIINALRSCFGLLKLY
jgi:hypothetical protein